MSDTPRDLRDRVTTTKTTRKVLRAFLDEQRAVIIDKIAGLQEEEARRSLVASGTSLAGIVKHLAYVERYWFQRVFGGRDVEFPWSEDDPDADWRVDYWETVEGLIAFYRSEIAESRRIEATAKDLDRKVEAGDQRFTLRWIMLHMIEETARHAGHADLLRESIDGATGG